MRQMTIRLRDDKGKFLTTKGFRRTKSGHLRISSGTFRDEYVHRLVVKTLLGFTHPLTLHHIPIPYEVHHVDFKKDHNCPSNLLLLEEGLHSAITARGSRRRGDGKFEPRWRQENLKVF